MRVRRPGNAFVRAVGSFLVVAIAAACAAPPSMNESRKTTGTLDPRWGEVAGALKVCATGTTVKGVDVSVYQSTIDWAKVAAAGYVFAIARIGHGTGVDTKFQSNWAGMKANGIVRGAYLFYAPTQDATAQAQNIIDAVGMLSPGDLPVTIDVEWTTGTPNATHLGKVVSLVTAGTGKKPMIYTALGYWDQYFTTEFGDLDLWVANWGVTCPSLPSSWTGWLFWQTSGGGGTVPGIPGGVDEDLFNGSLDDLKAAAGLSGESNCSTTQALNCGAFGCGCADNACSGGACPGSGCSAKAVANCGAFGCGCSDGQCSGGACPGSGCTYKETTDCAATGCDCVDHLCSGGACGGSGCTYKETTDCSGFGCSCAKHACVCDTGECTAAEASGCAAQGCQCKAHACTECVVPAGCTADEIGACGAQGCQCADHICTQCTAGASCTSDEIATCGASGCGCADHVCSGGQCPGNGCTATATAACAAQGKACWLGGCKDPAPPGEDVSLPDADVVQPPADVVDADDVGPIEPPDVEAADVATEDVGMGASDVTDRVGEVVSPRADATEAPPDSSVPGAGADIGAGTDVVTDDASGGTASAGSDAVAESKIAIGHNDGGCAMHVGRIGTFRAVCLLLALGWFVRRRTVARERHT